MSSAKPRHAVLQDIESNAKQNLARFKLETAAPDMLAALETVKSMLEAQGMHKGAMGQIVNEAIERAGTSPL
jgi:hypothetical protein